MKKKHEQPEKFLLRDYKGFTLMDAGPEDKAQPDGKHIIEVSDAGGKVVHSEGFSRFHAVSLNAAIERAKEWVNGLPVEPVEKQPGEDEAENSEKTEVVDQGEGPVFDPPKLRTCRVCGCTDGNCDQCVAKTGKPCHWVEADLCSACVEEPDIKVTDERASTIAKEEATAVQDEASAIEPQETNFFSQLLALAKPGKVDVSLRIMEVNSKLTVSFMPKDKSTNLPVNCTATAEAFDRDFFKQIIPQVKEIEDLITHNIEEVKSAAKESGGKEPAKKANSSTTASTDSKSTPAKKKKWKKPVAKKKPGQNSNVTAKKKGTSPVKKSTASPIKKENKGKSPASKAPKTVAHAVEAPASEPAAQERPTLF
jgi:hypothetical protein